MFRLGVFADRFKVADIASDSNRAWSGIPLLADFFIERTDRSAFGVDQFSGFYLFRGADRTVDLNRIIESTALNVSHDDLGLALRTFLDRLPGGECPALTVTSQPHKPVGTPSLLVESVIVIAWRLL